MKLAYITNGRIPSERANAMQTVQMCAAFAAAGAEVTLYHPARRNPQFDGVDVWQYYGVPRAFRIQPVPCVDLFHLSGGRVWNERPVFWLQTFTFVVSLVWLLLRSPADLYYSRDPFVLALLALGLPHARKRMLFEAHSFPQSRIGRAFRRWALRRVKGTVTISHALEKLYVGLGLQPNSVMFEYMAAARPIIASDLPVLREVLGDGPDGNAVLVAPDDAASLADGLRRVLNDDNLANRLAALVRRDVEAYTWEARARGILKFAASETVQ